MYDRFLNENGIDGSSVYTFGTGYCTSVEGVVSAAVNLIPSGDGDLSSGWTGGPLWSLVDDPPASPDDNATFCANYTNVGGYGYFAFPTPDISPYATITNVRVYVRSKLQTTGTLKIRSAVKVNGTRYGTVATEFTVTSSWATYDYTFSTNPDTGLAWIAEDILGTGPHPLQQIGVYSSTNNANGICFTQLYGTVTRYISAQNMVLISNPVTSSRIASQGRAVALVKNIDASTKIYISSATSPSWTELTNLTLVNANIGGPGINLYLSDIVAIPYSADKAMRWKAETDEGHGTLVYRVATDWA
jgi:hypothetical protein